MFAGRLAAGRRKPGSGIRARSALKPWPPTNMLPVQPASPARRPSGVAAGGTLPVCAAAGRVTPAHSAATNRPLAGDIGSEVPK